MKIAIIGAGFAGLSSARVLTAFGHDVVVYEKAADVGGVWSAGRRYPGLHTQNNKGTYHLSELRMPREYPEWPSGEQVQAYLESYVEKFRLAPHLRLSTHVVSTAPVAGGGWSVTTAAGTETYDHMVVASGIFSRPFVPTFEGMPEFEFAGGQVMVSTGLHDLAQVRGKHVVVIGYGKSACDVAVEVARAAESTSVVARELLWKMPKRIRGLNYKYLMLTRLGEGLFRYRRVSGMEKVLHAHNSRIADSMLGSVEKVTTGQLNLRKLGLVPNGTFKDIARSTVSLATGGFFEAVGEGRITVHRDTVVERLLEKDGFPWAELADGTTVRADVVLAATGWSQELPFLPTEIVDRLTDDNGDYLLYRQIHPIGIKDLSFAGYNSSFFSPLSAEMSALWIASLLAGNHELPLDDTARQRVDERLAWTRERTRGHHARGTNVIPFSLHNIDEVLSDIGMNVSAFTRARQWLLPINPRSYRRLTGKLSKRLARAQ